MSGGPRIGLGYDSHRLKPGGPLRLGGIDVPHTAGFDAHSDGDVLLHAVIDALLGAAALGDIGELFPDTDPRHAGRDSAELLGEAWQRVQTLGYQMVNLDCVILAQRPQLGPHKQAIRRRLAELLGVADEQVAVKAKTGERVGPVGREEAIEARCVVLLQRTPAQSA